MKRFDSIAAATRHLRSARALNGVRVVSFDVFDTLLFRRLDKDVVSKGVSAELTRWLTQRGYPPRRSLWEARHEAYRAAAQHNADAGRDFDASLEELVPRWLELAVQEPVGPELRDGFVRRALAVEEEFEAAACFANDAWALVLEELRRRNLRVVFTSDMYLGRDRIARLLQRVGFGQWFHAGYVSCDVGALKATGRLFRHLLEQEACAPTEVLHVGDNPESDGRQPQLLGIRSMVVDDRGARARRRALAYDRDRLGHDRAHAGYAIAASASIAHRGATAEEEYGFRILGPILSAFLHRVAERCRHEGVRRAYFLAREGYALMRAFEHVQRAVFREGDGPEAYYLCVSRLTSFVAASRAFGLRELTLTLGNRPVHTARTLLAPFALPPELLEEAAREAGIDDVDLPLDFDIVSWPPMQRLLEHARVAAAIRERSAATRAQLQAYLESMRFFEPGPIALVDVGWGGQVQDNLVRAFSDRPDFPRVFGLYLGVRRSALWRQTPKSSYEGVLADETDPNWHGHAAFEFVQAFEALTRAPHGTVLGYRTVDCSTRPVFRSDGDPARQREAADDERIALIQEGLFEFARRYGELGWIIGARPLETLGYARSVLDRMIRFPTPVEAQWLLQMSNVADLGLTDTVPLGSWREGLTQVLRLHDFRQRLGGSFWKQGLVAGLGRAALLAYNVRRGVRRSPPATEWRGRVGVPEVERRLIARAPGWPGELAEPVAHAEAQLRREIDHRHAQLVEAGRRRADGMALAASPVGALDLVVTNAAFGAVNFLNERAGRVRWRPGGVGVKPLLGRWAHQLAALGARTA